VESPAAVSRSAGARRRLIDRHMVLAGESFGVGGRRLPDAVDVIADHAEPPLRAHFYSTGISRSSGRRQSGVPPNAAHL